VAGVIILMKISNKLNEVTGKYREYARQVLDIVDPADERFETNVVTAAKAVVSDDLLWAESNESVKKGFVPSRFATSWMDRLRLDSGRFGLRFRLIINEAPRQAAKGNNYAFCYRALDDGTIPVEDCPGIKKDHDDITLARRKGEELEATGKTRMGGPPLLLTGDEYIEQVCGGKIPGSVAEMYPLELSFLKVSPIYR
jgi:hypothetical protein